MNSLYNYRFSFVAGAFAALGSFFGKMPSVLVGSDDASFLRMSSTEGESYTGSGIVRTCVHLICFVVMIICNVINWRYFLKALQQSEQTITTTVLTAASNYSLSFILAIIFFGEPITYISVIGSIFILAGLWYLAESPKDDLTKKLK